MLLNKKYAISYYSLLLCVIEFLCLINPAGFARNPTVLTTVSPTSSDTNPRIQVTVSPKFQQNYGSILALENQARVETFI
jgi:hypothetical protein